MTTEQKAKAYDEALEKARLVLQERGNEPDGASVLSDLFPELTESEDERIRNAIIDHIRHSAHNIPADKFNTWIAWLEKQGKQKPNKCMYSNDNYTDEDRKVLCDGCEEDCKLKQKPVEWSEDLVKEALLSEVLPCFMHGGEADEVVAMLGEKLNKR